METNSLGLAKLQSRDPKTKYGFAKELVQIAKDDPAFLYPWFDQLTELLDSENNILKWNAFALADILGYLSKIDSDQQIDGILPKLTNLLHSGHLITCNHAIFALGLTAQNKPAHQTAIINELLKVANDTFETETCRAIAMGKVLETLHPFAHTIKDNTEVMQFMRDAQASQRNATKNKADRLLRKLEKVNNH